MGSLNSTEPLNMWTHLEHQPEQDHHSNNGNNVCMVLDDELVAQHRRVLVRLLSDAHVDALPRTPFFAFLSFQMVRDAPRCGSHNSPCFLHAQGHEWRVTLLF